MREDRIGAVALSGGNGSVPASPPDEAATSIRAGRHQRVLAIGVSFDGVRAIAAILRGLPDPFPGAVLVVLHRAPGGQPGVVVSRLAGRAVIEPEEGAPLETGRIYVAPGDRHLVVRDGRLEVERTEKVRFSRPSIDVLFRSVAEVYGPRAIGVLLSGYGFDGVAGLQAIKARGGTTIVQDPSEARAPYLPRAAVAADGIDMTLPLAEIGPAIGHLVSGTTRPAAPFPEDTAAE